ncbi:hypothetical protein MBANPS3_002755 [Mucor bainieri]
MANHSPHPNSLSPHSKQPTSAFQWPIPPSSPSHMKPNTQSTLADITVKEILERYNEDPELLKYILTAKTEEDKRKAAKDTLRAEEARIQLRHMDLELCREQAKASAKFERPVYPPGQPQPYPHAVQAVHHHTPVIAHPAHPHHPYPYYNLAPVQQQVLARFQQPPQHAPGQHQPPASPSIPYPHSAHPLCPPATDEKNFASRLPQFRQPSPSAAAAGQYEDSKKRSRASISSPNEGEQDKLLHTKVMEALKAKIQRGSGGPLSPLTAPPIRPPPSASTSTPSQDHPNKKKKPALPRPVVVHQVETASSPSPSPRSAKPVLPPIDTNLGRMDTTVAKATVTTTTRTVTKSDMDSTSSTASSNSSGHQETAKTDSTAESTRQQRQQNAKSSIDINSTASPSDHILLNTRRARSLSPSSSTSSSSSSSSSSSTANTNTTANTTKKIAS